MREHIRPGPILGIGGLLGLLAIVVGQCTPRHTDAPSAAFGEPVPPVIVDPDAPIGRPSTTARATTLVVPATPSVVPVSPTSATVLPTQPPTTPAATPPATAAPTAPPTAPAAPAPSPTPPAGNGPSAPAAPAAAPPPEPTTPDVAVAEPPPPPPPATEPPAPTTTVAAAPVSDAVALVNEQRAAAGVPALTESAALTDAARSHSIDQASRQEMTHIGSDGSDAGARIARAGFAATAWAENVAAGFPTSASVIDGWMGSSGHRDNMLSASYTAVGIASAQAGDGTTYWTMVLAA